MHVVSTSEYQHELKHLGVFVFTFVLFWFFRFLLNHVWAEPLITLLIALYAKALTPTDAVLYCTEEIEYQYDNENGVITCENTYSESDRERNQVCVLSLRLYVEHTICNREPSWLELIMCFGWVGMGSRF